MRERSLIHNININEEEKEDRWLITYADMITLLMVFFVVMYAIAEVKSNKLETLSYALTENFNATSKNPGSGEAGDFALIRKYILGDDRAEGQDGNEIVRENSSELSKKILTDLGKSLKKNLEQKKSGKMVNIEVKKGELVISLNTGRGFFECGSSDIDPDTAQVLDVIAGNCRKLPSGATIRVEGYTCDLPVTSGDYPSNWELSTARATNVARYLIEKGNLNPSKLSAAGYGQYHPKVPNTSEKNRAINRRVEITVIMNSENINNMNP